MGERVNGLHEVRGSIPLASIASAGIAQLVEHNLAKVGVAGSSPVSRLKAGVGGARCRGLVVANDDLPTWIPGSPDPSTP